MPDGKMDRPSIWRRLRAVDGRWLLFALLGAFWGNFGIVCATAGEEAAYKPTGVPWMGFSFGDLRVILAGMESYREGLDPLLENPHDPWNRRMNYPRVWMLLTPLGWTGADTPLVGTGLTVLFYATFFAWVGRLTLWQAPLYAVALLSAPDLMAILRGNNDVAVFVLLALGVLAVRCWPRIRPALYLWFFVLSVLKYYPILGLFALGRERSRAGLAAGIVAALLFVVLIGCTFRELGEVDSATPRPEENGYGRIVGRVVLSKRFHLELSPSTLHVVSLAACGVVFVLAAYASRWLPRTGAGQRADDFLLGAGIFLGSFLFGSNWNYRLIYLLFLFPQALRWAGGRGSIAWLGRLLLFTILCACWSEYPLRLYDWYAGILLEQAVLWLVFGLTATLAFSLWRSPGAPAPVSRALRADPMPVP